MITLTIKMMVIPEKRDEFLQTLTALIKKIRKERGCTKCSLFQDVSNADMLILDEEWESRRDLDHHMKSDRFRVLRGATSYLLSGDPEITISTVSNRAGMKALKL